MKTKTIKTGPVSLVGLLLMALMMVGIVPAHAVTATGSISGMITAPAGTDFSQVWVHATSDDGSVYQSGIVQSNGSYNIAELPAGSYKVQVNSYNQGLADTYFGGSSFRNTATAIKLTTAQQAAGKDISLVKEATISGKVSLPVGAATSDASLFLTSDSNELVRMGSVTQDGSYTFGGLGQGKYKLQYSGAQAEFFSQWYKNADSFATATVLTLAAGQAQKGIDFAPVKGASISGKVSVPTGISVSDVQVDLLSAAGGNRVDSALVNPDGTYELKPLKAGDYKVLFRQSGDGELLDRWYKNASTFETATTVSVKLGQNLAAVDASMVKGGSITGKVTGPAGEAASGVAVFLRTAVGNRYVADATLAADGTYNFGRLHAGSYTVEFGEWNKRLFLAQWYKNATSYESATPVTVNLGKTTSGINAVLVKGGTVSGKVSVPVGSKATELDVYAYKSSDKSFAASVTPNADGTYALTGLSTGNYKIQFRHWGEPVRLADQWYKGANSFESAAPVAVVAGTAKTGINATMVQGGYVAGKITAGGVGGSYAVDVLNLDGSLAASSYSNPDGSYNVSGLAAGSYKIAFNRASGPSLTEAQYYDKKGESQGIAAAKILSVTSGKTAANINANLTAGGSITGVLLDSVGKPLAKTKVVAYSRTGVLIGRRGTTDAAGKFTVAGLSTGSYAVVANPEGRTTATMPGVLYSGNVTVEAKATQFAAAVGKSISAGTLSYKAAATPVLKVLTAPVPKVSGLVVSGQKLTAAAGAWGPAPVTLKYQWKRSGVAISNATASTYVLTSSDVGKKITVTVTGTKAGYITATKTSVATAAVTAPKALASVVPKVSGLVVSGQKLTAAAGAWGPAPVTLKYQWKRSGVAITNATASSYVLAAADVGKAITVTVTGSKAGYVTAAKTSAATKAVTAK